MNNWAIVASAGKGKRMGGGIPKQYQSLAGEPVLQHTLKKLTQTQLFAGIVLAAQPNDGRAQALSTLFKDIIPACGGAERIHTVRNALAALEGRAAPEDWVFVHDAARPCVRPEDILRLHAAIQDHPVGGLLALPMRDTVKWAEGGHAVKTADRSVLWQALTPQAFRYGLLREAITNAITLGLAVTDEASALEAQGHAALLVEGSSDNLKITYPQDLFLAEKILEQQESTCA
jgi:2-C-methyl-D-erythritol 4-phosphate cytidylyltransferase